MADIEPLKPSNTGWLIADVVPDTFAFGWARTEVHPDLLELLADPQWQPYVVFPGEFVAPERVVTEVAAAGASAGKRPLFILLDATWPEGAQDVPQKPVPLDRFPVLSLQPEQIRATSCAARAGRPFLHRRSGRPVYWTWPASRRPRRCCRPTWTCSPTTTCRPGHQLPPDWQGEAHQRLAQGFGRTTRA